MKPIRIQARCLKCEKIHLTPRWYTGTQKIPPMLCVPCKIRALSSKASFQNCKKNNGVEHSYEKLSESTISRRGIDLKTYKIHHKALELRCWQKHRNDVATPLPNWMLRLGDTVR